MEVNETVLCMCRLCLNYTGDCSEIVENNAQNVAFQGKMKKYLNLEVGLFFNAYISVWIISKSWSFFFSTEFP